MRRLICLMLLLAELAPASFAAFKPSLPVYSETALSPAELKAVGEEKDVISKEKAESIARDNKYLPIDSSLTMKNAELYKHDESSASQGYEWSLRFTSAEDKNRSAAVWVNIDAKTGAITSVSGWSDNDKEASDSSAAKSAAVNAAKDFLGAKFAEYKLNAPENSEDAVGNFIFSRYVNGVKVADDDAYITVNADGKVTYFSCDYHNVEFPSAEAVSKDKVFASVFASDDFDCGYIGFRTMDGKELCFVKFRTEAIMLRKRQAIPIFRDTGAKSMPKSFLNTASHLNPTMESSTPELL